MDKVKNLVAAHSKSGEVVAVGIEDFMRAFGGAAWRTTDIFKLAQLNSAVSYSCFQMLGHKPIHVHPTVWIFSSPSCLSPTRSDIAHSLD